MKFIDEKFFLERDGKIQFIGQYMEVYVPKYFFDKKIAQIIGSKFAFLGIVNFVTFNDADGKKPNPVRTLNLPATITSEPSSYEDATLDLVHVGDKEDYTVLKFYNGDILCASELIQELTDFKKLFNLLISGKFPRTLKYDDILTIVKDNIKAANIKIDAPDFLFELIIAETYRDKSNRSKRFGMKYGGDLSMSGFEYEPASSQEIARINSTFTGISFERFDDMLISSVVGDKRGRTENKSPMEDLIKY